MSATPPEKFSIGNLPGRHYFYLSVLVVIYVVMILVVNPIGNFPLNDDWIYAHPVLSLITNGTYGSLGWSVSTIFTQVVWGLLFCAVSGSFSFTALRFSTLTLGLTGILILYLLVYDVFKNKKVSFLSALLLLVNPIYFCCSNTFMTDVPFISMALFAIYFFFKALDTNNRKFLILATLFSVATILVRQLGFILPVAYALTAASKPKQTLLKRLWHFIPLVISIAAYEGYIMWLHHNGTGLFWIPTDNYSNLSSFFSNPLFWLYEIARRLGGILFYFGLLFLPILLIIKPDYSLLKPLKLKIVTVILLAGVTITYILVYRINVAGNFLHNDFVGPRTIYNGVPNIADLSIPFFWYIPAILGANLLALHLMCTLLKMVKNYNTPHGFLATTFSSKYLFIVLTISGYIILLFYPATYFDRYQVPLFAWFCILIAFEPTMNRSYKIPVLIITSIYVAVLLPFSSLATHDYLAWNRARWKAIDYLTKDLNTSAHTIVAGYEANGWLTGYGRQWDIFRPYCLTDGDEYLVSFTERDGYRTLNKYVYESYIPPFNRNVYVLHNELDETAQKLKEQVYSNPQNATAYFQLGLLYLQMEDFDNAIWAWSNYSRIDPQNAYCYNNLGYCYLRKLNYNEAEANLKKAIAIKPDLKIAYISLIICYQSKHDEQARLNYIKLALAKGITTDYMRANNIKLPGDLLK